MARHLWLKKALASTLTFAAFSAYAGLTGSEVLQQFNLVVLNNINSTSHVDGRTYVGGSVSGGDYAQHGNNLPASSYAGLTAGGAVSNLHVNGKGLVAGGSVSNSIVNSGDAVVNGAASNTTFNGKAYVAGAVSSVNFNGGQAASLAAGTPAMQAAAAAAGSTNFGQVMTGLSDQLSLLASTGSSVLINGGKATFNAVANSSGLAVFDLTLIDSLVFGLGEFEFNFGNATTVIFNTDNTTYDIHANFLGGSAMMVGTKAIWNFYNAQTIQMSSQFGGVVLATDAVLTNSQNIEGTVVVEELNQYGEIHRQTFTGNVPPPNEVPEPGTLLLVGAGILGLRLRSRRA